MYTQMFMGAEFDPYVEAFLNEYFYRLEFFSFVFHWGGGGLKPMAKHLHTNYYNIAHYHSNHIDIISR